MRLKNKGGLINVMFESKIHLKMSRPWSRNDCWPSVLAATAAMGLPSKRMLGAPKLITLVLDSWRLMA